MPATTTPTTTTLPIKRSASETFSDGGGGGGQNKSLKTDKTEQTEQGMDYLARELFRCPEFMNASAIDWRRYADLLPTNDGEVPAFFYAVLQQHWSGPHGSYELQLLVHALRFYTHCSSHQHGLRYLKIIDAIVEYVKSRAAAHKEMGEWAAYQLRQKGALVFFEFHKLSDGRSIARPVLPYHSFRNETWDEFESATASQ